MFNVLMFQSVVTKRLIELMLLQDEEYNTEETHNGLFHSDSNRQLMSMWLKNEEHRSLADHIPTMRMVQYLAMSILQDTRANR